LARVSLRGLKRLTVLLLALSAACFVVAAVTYEPAPSGWFSYTPLSEDPLAGTDHWRWIAAGVTFLVSAAAVALAARRLK